MKKIIKFIILLSLLAYYQSFAATVGYYNNHLAPYTNPGSSNLGGMGPNMGTFCDDDGDGDGTFNRVSSANNSTTTDPESGLLSSVPAAGTMRCLYYDAVAPSGIINYDFTHLNDQQKITVTITCTDAGGSGCDTTTNNSVNTGLGWTVLGGNQYRKVCSGIDLNSIVTVSNTASCAGPITFEDISGRVTNLNYSATGTGTINQNLSTQLKIKGIAQSSSNTNAAGIKANDSTANAVVKDNFSKINKLNLKTTILKNVDKLLKSVNRSAISSSSITISDLNNIASADKIITSGSKTVYYFKDKNITINSGVHNINNKNITLIIERGNLKIKGDVSYLNGGMLGLILLGNKDGTKSNVYVDENITNGAGILYTDGTVQSTYNNAGSDNNIYTSANINDRGLNQLYWKGSFISQNTVGGSIGSAKCPYGTTEYISKACNTSIAQKYDLLLFRRYSLMDGSKYYGITSSAGTPFTVTSVPFGSSNKTIYISGGRGFTKSGAALISVNAGNSTYQDKNISNSFILDYDSRITGKSAPLGFSSN